MGPWHPLGHPPPMPDADRLLQEFRPTMSAHAHNVRSTQGTMSRDVLDCPQMFPDAGGGQPASQAECRGFESHQPLHPKPLRPRDLAGRGENESEQRAGRAAALLLEFGSHPLGARTGPVCVLPRVGDD